MRTRVLLLIPFLLLMTLGLSAQSSVTIAQKIIHIEKYEPMPGDIYTLRIDMGSSRSEKPIEYTVMLQEDYILELPIIGSLNVKGMVFSQVRNTVTRRIKSAMPIQYVSFTLSAPAQFDIFVYGKVKAPGMITVNSLMRLTDVIAVTGGFTIDASTRLIQVNGEQNKKVYDLSSYYTFGDTEQNPYLKPGLRIYIPQRQDSVTLTGAVAKPGLYEILPGDTLETILQHAGGFAPTAQEDTISVLRLNERNEYSFLPTSALVPASLELRNGDRISVRSSLENLEKITVEGAFYGKKTEEGGPQTIPSTPLRFTLPYYPGMTLLDVLEAIGGPTPFAQTEKSYIFREENAERIPLESLAALWEEKTPSFNMPIQPNDYLVVPMQKLKVFVSGEVNNPGSFDYIQGSTVGDYLLLAGGPNPKRANLEKFFMLDELGKRKQVSLETQIQPADHIYVDRSGWTKTKDFFGEFFVIVGWVSGIIALTDALFDLNGKL